MAEALAPSGVAAPRLRHASAAPLSIGMFTYSTQPRGSVVCAAALADALAHRGHDVVLYALDKGAGRFYRELDCPLRLVPTAAAPAEEDALIAQRVGELAGFLAETGVRHDVCHAQDCLVASGLVAGRRHLQRAQLVRTVHHVDDFASPYLMACQRRSIQAADGVVSVSRSTQRAVRASFEVDSPVVHAGLDASRFERREVEAFDELRATLPIEGPFLLSIGGLEPRKNRHRELQAFLRIRDAHPELTWVIAGGASLWQRPGYVREFRAQLARADAESAVRVTGVLTDAQVVALFQHCAAYLHAATHEGWGLSVVEGLAAGAPVVVSRGAPFDEYLEPGAAVRVDAHDPASIAAGIARALATGRRSAPLAETQARKFSWDRCAAEHEPIYQSLVPGRAASNA